MENDDEKALELFMSANPPARRTLADIIQEKITEKQTEIASQISDNARSVLHYNILYALLLFPLIH